MRRGWLETNPRHQPSPLHGFGRQANRRHAKAARRSVREGGPSNGTIAQSGEQPPCKRKTRVRFPLAPPPAFAKASAGTAHVGAGVRRSFSEDGPQSVEAFAEAG